MALWRGTTVFQHIVFGPGWFLSVWAVCLVLVSAELWVRSGPALCSSSVLCRQTERCSAFHLFLLLRMKVLCPVWWSTDLGSVYSLSFSTMKSLVNPDVITDSDVGNCGLTSCRMSCCSVAFQDLLVSMGDRLLELLECSPWELVTSVSLRVVNAAVMFDAPLFQKLIIKLHYQL